MTNMTPEQDKYGDALIEYDAAAERLRVARQKLEAAWEALSPEARRLFRDPPAPGAGLSS